MYKIMTKLHTSAENIFGFHMVTNDNEELVEYAVKTKDEAAETALELLGRVGYEDLRIVDDKSYYLDLIYGRKPVPEENLYKLTIDGPNTFHAELAYKGDDTPEPVNSEDFTNTKMVAGGSSAPEPIRNILVVNDIKLNETVSINIRFDEEIQSYHFVINNVEYKTGLPKWITYDEYNETSGRLTFNGITRDYYIEVIIDDPVFNEPEIIILEEPKDNTDVIEDNDNIVEAI